ncbi:conserved Plasmodium protein, unknown function [Plasmodium relictum]|uniref:Symplekin C-terminal domain-containing protein n=1 Tax=Plasmodium relictum TaxID=85471 RepID=A0A1J1HEX2_PLARL|nr:conserved Plasmodium protein, unknown function [Plasmodium relictum]CRH02610.1 conserved Plasmodium protein, unknown function [Plasmodium relictum]
MLKNKKKKIQKIIQFLESNEEDEKILVDHINEIEQIFFECFNNENKKKSKIINTYVIPYVNLLLERINNPDNKNHMLKERLLTRVLTFFSSILRINKNYSYLIISYFVNLIEQKYYLIKIIEYLKKLIIYLLKGLLFSKNFFYDCLDNVKQGFHNYVILKSKVFNILTNFYFDKYLIENPYKYDLIKNLMLILSKEILFFFHILKNKNKIFKETLNEEKRVHHVINEIFGFSYLNEVTNKVNLKKYDEIILIWVEQNISLFNDLIIFNLSKNVNIKNNEDDINTNKEETSKSVFSEEIKVESDKNIKKEINGKKEFIKEEKVNEDIIKNEEGNSKENSNFQNFGKLIYYLNKNKCNTEKNTNGELFSTDEKNNVKNENEAYIKCEYFYENLFFNKENNKEEKEGKKNPMNKDYLINTINQISVDNIIFLTHLMKNVFNLIREDPFILNFFIKNIFLMVEKLLDIREELKKKGNYSNNNNNTNINNYKEKLFDCMFHYIKNELYLLICKKNINFPFYYSYITQLLNLIGENGTTDELIKKKIESLNIVYSSNEKERKRKLNEKNYNYEYVKKNILRKEDYGYKKFKNEEIDIMSYLKVKMNENENENQDDKKEEKENIFINKIIKKLYLTNFKLDKEYYEQFDCSRKNKLMDFFCKNNNNTDINKLSKNNIYENYVNPYEKNTIDNNQDIVYNQNSTDTNAHSLDILNSNMPCDSNNIERITMENYRNHYILNAYHNSIDSNNNINKYDNNIRELDTKKDDEKITNEMSMKNNFFKINKMNYSNIYEIFLKNSVKYFDNIKNNETILGNIDLYFFLIFTQILNNNLENKVQTLGENVYIRKINNLKTLNNIIKRIILNDMLKEKYKFFFLTLYIIKINSSNVFNNNTTNDIFLNYSTIFKICNNLLFYSYIQEKKKKKKLEKLKLNKYNDILGYTIVCYNYFYKVKKKLKKNSYIYRNKLQKKNFKMKCKYDEILNIIIYFLHNEKLLANYRDQYIKTFIEQILETPKLSSSFFIYLIFWLNNIDINIDYKGYINNSNSDNSTILKNEKKEIIEQNMKKLGLLKNEESKIEDNSSGVIKKNMLEEIVSKSNFAILSKEEHREKNISKNVEYNMKEEILMDNKKNTSEKIYSNNEFNIKESDDKNVSLLSSNMDNICKNSFIKSDMNKIGNKSLNYSESVSSSYFDVESSSCNSDFSNEKNTENEDALLNEEGNCHNGIIKKIEFDENEVIKNDNSLNLLREKLNNHKSNNVNVNTCKNDIEYKNNFLPNNSINNKKDMHQGNSLSNNQNNNDICNSDRVKEIYNSSSNTTNNNSKNNGTNLCTKFDDLNNNNNNCSLLHNKIINEKENNTKITTQVNEMEEKLFNINYYIKYSEKNHNSSNYVLCFSLISNLLKKNQNIRVKKTMMSIYINTVYSSSNEVRKLLKKLITASKGIYNNSINYLVYTKKIYIYYHKIFTLFLLYICDIYFPNLKNDIIFFSHFASYLWPIELINFLHNFLITNFSFFYNDIISIFVNYEKIKYYEKSVFFSKNYEYIDNKLNEYIKDFDNSNLIESLECFLKETDFFNSNRITESGESNSINTHTYTDIHQEINNFDRKFSMRNEKLKDIMEKEEEEKINFFIKKEEEECLHRNEISQKILLEEIFVLLFIKTIDIMEEKLLFDKLKKTNIFLNFVSIDFINELCNFVILKIENVYEKKKSEFWQNFDVFLNETIEEDKGNINNECNQLELLDIFNFLLNSIDNFLSICIRSSIFFHLYLFIYSNCINTKIKNILLNKFIATLPLLKSLFHEEFFRILKYNNKINKQNEDNLKNEYNNAVKENTEKIREKLYGDNEIKEEIENRKSETENEQEKEKEKEINTESTYLHENNSFQINIEIIKYISKKLYESSPKENNTNFLNFCYNLYLENNNFYFIIELIGFLKKEQTLQIFNDIIKNNMEENKKIEILKCCINNIIKLPYSYILEKEKENKNENESYYITNIEIFYFYYNLNKNKNIQKIMLDYFVTKVNLNTVDDEENHKMYNDITIKDLASIIQQIAEHTNSIFPIYGRFLCQITKNIDILREYISSIIIPLLIQKKIWNNKFIWKGCLMCISMLWPDFKHSLFYIFFMLPSDECTILFHALQQKHSIESDLVDLISSNEQAKRMCPDYLKNLLNT